MFEKIRNMLVGPEGDMNEEARYINDRRAALLLHSPRGARLLVYLVLCFFFVFLVWAVFAEIDETVKGKGTVTPSKRLQQVQHLEGGVIKDILVVEGQTVDKDELLMVISDSQVASSIGERETEYYSLMAKERRLFAESLGKEPDFPAELQEKHPNYIEDEISEFKANQKKQEDNVEVFNARARQQQGEKEKLRKQLGHAVERDKISADKVARMQRLFKQGAVSELDVIEAREDLDDWKSKIENLRQDITKTTESIKEIEASIAKIDSDFRSAAGDEHNKVKSRMRTLEASLLGLSDKKDRTQVKSPVKGVVNKVNITTIGGVVQPGRTVVEIVPLDDKLVIETKVAPKDIGFLRPGMKAKVKLSAYNFATYGGLEGELKNISADAITTPKGQTFFKVLVETERTSLGTPGHPLPIIPGMQAEVDIIVDRKSVVSFLLKPLLKAKSKFITPSGG